MMLERLDFWLAVFTLGALAYFELRLGRFIGPIVRGVLNVAGPAAEEVVERVKRRSSRRLPTTVRLQSRPIRSDAGRFNGSLPAVPVRSGRIRASRGCSRGGLSLSSFRNRTPVHFSPRLCYPLPP
jgi:hypothetical protein